MYDLLVVGGGAAGYFGAIHACAGAGRRLRVAILEAGREPLQKVRISGGGRCNVTHAAFDPKELCMSYPRGRQELLGPFTRFSPGDTMAWFEDRGVPLKIEDDGRVFPISDDSGSIVRALTSEATRLGIALLTGHRVTAITKSPSGFQLTGKNFSLSAKHVLYTPGSNPNAAKLLGQHGVSLIAPVPSLFTFNVKHSPLTKLLGLSVPNAQVSIDNSTLVTRGPLLVTHWGMSGPAVLRASAEGALLLHARGYQTGFRVSWTGLDRPEMLSQLDDVKRSAKGKTLSFSGKTAIPKRLWLYLLTRAKLSPEQRWADLTNDALSRLAQVLSEDRYKLNGTTRFKEEFVTAGGVDLRHVNFKSFELKQLPGVFGAGEVLNIDGITGGFNFQAAWTGGYHAGTAIAKRLTEPAKANAAG